MSSPGLVEIYLSFDGNCMEALRFYEQLLGGEMTYLQQWNEIPQGDWGNDMPEINPEWVMHASFKVGDITIMAADNPYLNTVFGDSVTLNWSHPDAEEVHRVWEEFIDQGGTVNMELEPTFFAPLFGQLTDAFGINWQIMQWNGEVE